MPHPISASQLAVLSREADAAARRLVRQLRLPSHQLEDIRQELLVDLIERMPCYDPDRGTLGAFAGTVVKHKASRLRAKISRDRALFGEVPISLDTPPQDADGIAIADRIREENGYGALFGQTVDHAAEVERGIFVAQALATLSRKDRSLCLALAEASVRELVTRGMGARTSLYRQIERIRLALADAGIAGA